MVYASCVQILKKNNYFLAIIMLSSQLNNDYICKPYKLFYYLQL